MIYIFIIIGVIFTICFLVVFLCKTLTKQQAKIEKNNIENSIQQINFIHIPKNAGTSIKELCEKSNNQIKYNYHNTDVNNAELRNQLIIIQHPVKRFCSAVYYALQKWSHTPHVDFLIKNEINTPDKWITIWSDKTHKHHQALMKEMKNENHYIGNKFLEYKWTYTPQTEYINNPKYVILLENLDYELNYLLKTLNIEQTIPNNNKTIHDNDIISEANLKFLTEFYQKDMEVYNKYKNISMEKRLFLPKISLYNNTSIIKNLSIFVQKNFNILDDLYNYVENNKYEKEVIILSLSYSQKNMLKFLEYIDSIENLELKIVVINNDDFWWNEYYEKTNKQYSIFWNKLLTGKNFFLTTVALNSQSLKEAWPLNQKILNEKILFDFNWWSSYEKSFNVGFNNNPVNKICVSGNIIKKHYPQRNKLLQFKNVERMPYNYDKQFNDPQYNYTKNLSQYICSFYSSVYTFSNKQEEYVNTHIILLKFYEILSSGSLILIPTTEKHFIPKEFIHKKNCWFIDMEQDNNEIQKTIDYITDQNNKQEIDSIRFSGKQMMKNYTTDKIIRKNYEKLINKLFE